MRKPGVRAREPGRRAGAVPVVLAALLALCLQALPAVAGAADPCTTLYYRLKRNMQKTSSGGSYVFARPTEVLGCTRSVPFNAQRDRANLRSVFKYFASFYSLIHIARRAPDPRVPSNYDIAAALRWLGTRKWRYAEDFYAAMANAIGKLNDAHTGLQTNCPPFYHSLALPLVSVVEGGRPVVRVAPGSIMSGFITTAAAANAPYHFNARAYVGAKVLSINGRPAWAYMVWWATNFAGGFHDSGQQVNNAFASVSWSGSQLQATPGAFAFRANNPKRNYVPMRLIRQGRTKAELVQVPWLTFASGDSLPGFANKQIFYQSFCQSASSNLNVKRPLDSFSSAQFFQNSALNSSTSSAAAGWAGNPEGEESAENSVKKSGLKGGAANSFAQRMRRREVVPPGFSVPMEDPLVAPAVDEAPAVKGPWKPAATRLSSLSFLFPVYLLRDGKTGVVVLGTFDANGNNAAEQLIYEAARSFSLANKYAKQVIVDVTNNGGGILQAGYWTICLLMGVNKFPNPLTRFQDYKQFLADTGLVLQMRNLNSYWYNWDQYEDVYERSYTAATAPRFFRPVSAQRFGPKGFVGRYSSQFKSQMSTLTELTGHRLGPILGKKRFLIFSNGLCFSTCQNFAFTLRREFGVLLVGVGGVPGRPLGFAGGGGGFVLGDVEQEMLNTIPPRLLGRPDAPSKFSIQLSLGMKFPLGRFLPNSEAPMEFTYMPADRKIGYTLANVGNPPAQWVEVAKFFK